MIKVYFQNKSNTASDLVAVFDDEEIYIACLNKLKAQAKKYRCVVVESETEENLENLIEND